MSIEEIKVGDYVRFEDLHGRVNKIENERVLCRFYGFTKWVPIAEIYPSEAGNFGKLKKKK